MSKKKSNGQAVRAGSTSSAGLPFWGWFLIGLLSGLLLAMVALWRGWLPKLKAADQPEPDASATAPVNSEAGIAETPKNDKPQYDFYSVLPEMETVVPKEELAAGQDPSQTPTPAGDSVSRYFLQAGSYRNADEADAAKAKLAFLGLKAGLQTVNINGVTWHRVRVGPFANTRELEAARQSLADNGVDAIALKESNAL